MSKRTRRTVRVCDYTGAHTLCWIDVEEAKERLAKKICYELPGPRLTLALMRPPRPADDKRGVIQSRNPSVAKKIVSLRKKLPGRGTLGGRGTLVRGGKGSGFENALLAVAAKIADAETVAALNAWAPESSRR